MSLKSHFVELHFAVVVVTEKITVLERFLIARKSWGQTNSRFWGERSFGSLRSQALMSPSSWEERGLALHPPAETTTYIWDPLAIQKGHSDWRVPNPPGANPLVAERAPWRSRSLVWQGVSFLLETPYRFLSFLVWQGCIQTQRSWEHKCHRHHHLFPKAAHPPPLRPQ